MSACFSIVRLVSIWLVLVVAVQADWLSDIGYTQLAAELGASMPTGAGIPLLQSEADNGGTIPDYLPQAGGPAAFAGTGSFAGKTFNPASGQGTDNGHAAAVATYFYANNFGLARGATEIHNYTANDFVDRMFSGNEPENLPGRVHNHSWAGSMGVEADDIELLRRIDFLIQRDSRIVSIPLANTPTVMQPLLGNNYHGITVGVRSGAHSQTGTNTDGSGRMKPDLVADATYTSHAAPIIGGAAAMLLQKGDTMADQDAIKPQTVKAILIAGASKDHLPQWQRDSSAEPYDDVFGAGEVNIRNAMHILSAGQQTYSSTIERGSTGWDFAPTTNQAAGRRYFFSIPAGSQANTFSAALIWHRSVTQFLGIYSSSLTDLTLELYAATAFTPGALLSASTSAVDNVEHLFLYNLPPGQYMLKVTASAGNRDYALAWQAVAGTGPTLSIRRTASQWYLDSDSLDPYATYVIESSPDLTAGSWTALHTFRTADTTPAHSAAWLHSTPAPERQFFRLRWAPVR